MIRRVIIRPLASILLPAPIRIHLCHPWFHFAWINQIQPWSVTL